MNDPYPYRDELEQQEAWLAAIAEEEERVAVQYALYCATVEAWRRDARCAHCGHRIERPEQADYVEAAGRVVHAPDCSTAAIIDRH
ncbi:MAG TPA: hypothetical protein VFQ22_07715 [Longimicrobiales bacterium]|nr:hypothetical protein [Longimicrobiales bacterium]